MTVISRVRGHHLEAVITWYRSIHRCDGRTLVTCSTYLQYILHSTLHIHSTIHLHLSLSLIIPYQQKKRVFHSHLQRHLRPQSAYTVLYCMYSTYIHTIGISFDKPCTPTIHTYIQYLSTVLYVHTYNTVLYIHRQHAQHSTLARLPTYSDRISMRALTHLRYSTYTHTHTYIRPCPVCTCPCESPASRSSEGSSRSAQPSPAQLGSLYGCSPSRLEVGPNPASSVRACWRPLFWLLYCACRFTDVGICISL